MMGIKLRLKPRLGDFVGALKEELQRRVNSGFSSVLEMAETRAKEEAPARSGRLRDSIRTHRIAPLKGSLTASTPYASFLHEGTGLYGPCGKMIIIKPKRRTALSWQGAGHPVRKVVQRGIRPMNFITKAIEDRLIKSAFREGFNHGGNHNQNF